MEDDHICKPIINTYHHQILFRKKNIYNTPPPPPPKFTDREMQVREASEMHKHTTKGWRSQICQGWWGSGNTRPLSTTSGYEEDTPPPRLPSSPSSCYSTLHLPARPVPKVSLLFLDLTLLCHNTSSSRVGFFWPSNHLPEPPATMKNSPSSWLSIYHKQRTM